ncbi:MAG: DUF1349 domain-containing protein [Chitinophagaceae bacterium]
MKSDMACLKLFFSLLLLFSGKLNAQVFSLTGRTVAKTTQERLASATISIYLSGNLASSVSNKEGEFNIYVTPDIDSVRFSMIGYKSAVLNYTQLTKNSFLIIALELQPVMLEEVFVRPLTAFEIIEKAIARLNLSQPSTNFETSGFYREIIKDRENYLSVAEALFDVQFFPAKKVYKLKLDKGRAKEDVTYTALFEDYHPGGGPQQAIENSFLTGIPPFLKQKELKKLEFKKEAGVYYDQKRLYVIAFDQRNGVKESLERGRVFIDADDFSIVKYEAETSPSGIKYIKHLTGTDKMFAGLLGIDFKRKGWKRTVEFIKAGDKWLLNYTFIELYISYKQPKKGLDLNLVLSLELLLDPKQNFITKEIGREEKWEKRQLARNFPFVFDSAYWGSAQFISPTRKIDEIVKAISQKNKDTIKPALLTGWNKFNEMSFVAYGREDSVTLIPTTNSRWEHDQTGPLLYREMENDFSLEAKVDISKVSANMAVPDKGFQQCGFIIREPSRKVENNISLTIGTNGSKNIKLFLTKTTNGKSRSVAGDAENTFCWLKLVKEGTAVSAYKRSAELGDWKLIRVFEIARDKKYQVGLIGIAHFSGNGPKMHPDIKGVFSDIKISGL